MLNAVLYAVYVWVCLCVCVCVCECVSLIRYVREKDTNFNGKRSNERWPIQFETRYRLGICACVFHCFPSAFFHSIFILFFFFVCLFFYEEKNFIICEKSKVKIFNSINSNVNDERTVFYYFNDWVNQILSRLDCIQKWCLCCKAKKKKRKKNGFWFPVRAKRKGANRRSRTYAQRKKNNPQWMKKDIYQSCLFIIQHLSMFENVCDEWSAHGIVIRSDSASWFEKINSPKRKFSEIDLAAER